MPKDMYADLCSYYEFMLGPLPWRDEFERALRETVSPKELQVFFLVPFAGNAPLDKLARKSSLPAAELQTRLERLAHEGLVMIYTVEGQTVYERGNPLYMTEQQVRKPEDTPRRTFFARFFNSILEGQVTVAPPTRTPYYRVLPVEATVTGAVPVIGKGRRTIPVDVPVLDSRGVLPIDVISEMIRGDAENIAVADCYCRRARRLLGKGCDHELQTCLVFNKAAEALVEYGTARRISYEEAMEIIWRAEEAGLVHNVDNCEGEIGSICNCCSCCSILLTSWQRGYTNADSPSRYRVVHENERCDLCEVCLDRCPSGARSLDAGARIVTDEARCLGCGLCVTACAGGANQMVLYQQQVRLPKTAEALYGKIGREALVGIALQRIAGWFRRA
jgi:Pyruvate/2-oxoacid:ferredoxin oxidoreductase delta subunit